MKNKIVDARGLPCPRPLIMAKKALTNNQDDETIVILIDNETSKENVLRFLTDNHIRTEIKNESGYYQISAHGQLHETIKSTERNTVICVTTDQMGRGDEKLGRILIQGFINTVKDLNPLPTTIIFYNAGVKLTTSDSPVIQSLEQLQKTGTKIIVCGTCVDFYSLKEKIKIGEISNMYSIMEKLNSATKVIYP